MSLINKTKLVELTCRCDAQPDCINTRHTSEGWRTRRYQCPKCGKRWSSIEVVIGDCPRGPGSQAMKALKSMLLSEALLGFKRELQSLINKL